VRRRDFITLLGGVAAAAWPLAVRAQQPRKLPTIGFVGPSTAAVDRPLTGPFMQRLAELGWAEGRSIVVDYRAAEGSVERAGEIATEFVRLNVDVIVTGGDAQALAAKRATATIPIVFGGAGDPVGNGLAQTLARPGGNATGSSVLLTDTVGKRLEILGELVPRLRRLAISGNFPNPTVAPELQAVLVEARASGLDVISSEFGRAEEIPPAIEKVNGHADALYICADPLVHTNAVEINALALAARLPVMHSFRENVEAGGLVSYGPDRSDLYRRAADLVDKILRGTKPSDIPVEQATKFTLVVNLKTAKALGLTIPESFLLRADTVIE
jgi:putative tryptophan/tyrosine transport system substrate-binding protein